MITTGDKSMQQVFTQWEAQPKYDWKGCVKERGETKAKMKCDIKGCTHHGGHVINPKDPQGRYINLCFHNQVELFTEYVKRYYNESKETG